MPKSPLVFHISDRGSPGFTERAVSEKVYEILRTNKNYVVHITPAEAVGGYMIDADLAE